MTQQEKPIVATEQNARMSTKHMIFTKELREKVRGSVGCAFYPARSRAYIEALEEIARAAQAYSTNSTPTNGVKLDAALEKVDRMRE